MNATAPTLYKPDADLEMLKVAREIAADMRPLEEILTAHNISETQWNRLKASDRFQAILSSAVLEWQSVTNSAERVRIKSMAFVEEALPEFYARAHDPKEPLSAKVELMKTVSRLAGIGGPVDGSVSGDRMVVHINLGADQKLSFTKDVTPHTVDLTKNE